MPATVRSTHRAGAAVDAIINVPRIRPGISLLRVMEDPPRAVVNWWPQSAPLCRTPGACCSVPAGTPDVYKDSGTGRQLGRADVVRAAVIAANRPASRSRGHPRRAEVGEGTVGRPDVVSADDMTPADSRRPAQVVRWAQRT